MNPEDFVSITFDLLKESKTVYFLTEPEILDFTVKQRNKLVFMFKSQKLEIEVNHFNILVWSNWLNLTVFREDVILLCWNIKSFFSYFSFYTGKQFNPKCSIVDLKVIGNFLGLEKNYPKSYPEAINRLRYISTHSSWKKLYKSLHLPLITKVLPALEIAPLQDIKNKINRHSYYEIEGQHNGRLKCNSQFANSLNPHLLNNEIKSILKPKGYDKIFAYADFKYCEVFVLQWLSKDTKLGELLKSNLDFYVEIHKLVTGSESCSEEQRVRSKRLFLPIMYGVGSKTLAENLEITEAEADVYYDKISNVFHESLDWIKGYQFLTQKEKFIQDLCGRPRHFEDKFYLARNFIVQSTAATVCLEKLVELYGVLKDYDIQLCASIHDGYVIDCIPKKAKLVFDICKSVLEKPSSLFEGLELKVQVKFGPRLNNLKVFWQ